MFRNVFSGIFVDIKTLQKYDDGISETIKGFRTADVLRDGQNLHQFWTITAKLVSWKTGFIKSTFYLVQTKCFSVKLKLVVSTQMHKSHG